ncbi:ABC transporter ATP-binding protein [Pseudogracilibacillus auburnensis]|uniref:Fluoroquinolone transport system ATP-binding protein n=1 Tax=Pseudogracilibacillus auburnensis TaxID=1494959 RepID=A0A2V3VXM6_9BACI|nr:ABC transporter ATP-binding protein [Pseudogracilibacillus auburnensis]PXW85684.1 fluoroquinolone transport system ATP-binding protein [Pseudogracilibacillus auburnensis]
MINVRDLTYTYPRTDKPTIKGVNFTIEQGEVFGFLGPSGAGKSTIQNILIQMLKGYHGNVFICNKELKHMKEEYFEKIGVAFEFPNFYTRFTAMENLTFFRSLYSEKQQDPMHLLEMVGLEKDAHSMFSELSKGMKMRLNFCRALLHNPEIIFLDEPTSGLDPVNKENVLNIIRAKKAEGKTIIITTHDMHVADAICDRVAFIINGKIALIDSPRALKLQYGLRKVHVEYKENFQIQSATFDLDTIGTNDTFARLLREKEIETIHSQETTLGSIFIDVTGRSLS